LVEGGFRHDGCSVRHRSQQAAESCVRGQVGRTAERNSALQPGLWD
jgi:hypothetical protein